MKIVLEGTEIGAKTALEVAKRLILIACPFAFMVDTEEDLVKEAIIMVDTTTIDTKTLFTVEKICYFNNLSVFEDNKIDSYTYVNTTELELKLIASKILN